MSEQVTDERVDAALARALELGEVGLQVAAYREGELVVDAWAGHQSEGGPPVDASTVFPIFSVTKAVTATAVHIQAERGLIDVSAPLAHYWPEYGVRGKETVTIEHVLSHRAGVPQMPQDVTLESVTDWEWMVARLAEVEPLYTPGTRNAYLSMVFGWLLGEVVRRTDPESRTFARFVDDEICQPLGMDAFWIGHPEDLESRVATLTYPGAPPDPPEGSPVWLAVPPQVGLTPDVFNVPGVRQGPIPAVGGVSDAKSIARFFAMIAGGGELDGVRLLSPERVESFLRPRPDFELEDETYGRVMPVGLGGFWLVAPGVMPPGSSARVLCHPGAGGAIGWADLDAGVGAAVVHNRMFGAPAEHPFAPLGAAVYEAVRLRV